jgi:hemerythrin
MGRLQWDERYSLGVPSLDLQNKMLVELVNQISELDAVDVDPAEISNILNELMEYVFSHFPQEEKYLSEIDFSDLVNHKDHHKMFKKKVCYFCQQCLRQNTTILNEIREYLIGWVQFHIFCMDMQTRSGGEVHAKR